MRATLFQANRFPLCVRILKREIEKQEILPSPLKKKKHERNECTSTVYNFRTVSFLSKIVSTSFQWQHLSQMEGRCLRKTNPTLTLYPEPHDVTLPTWQALPTTHQP